MRRPGNYPLLRGPASAARRTARSDHGTSAPDRGERAGALIPPGRPRRLPLRLDARPVAAAQVAPAQVKAGVVGDGKPGRQFLIEVDTQARPVVGMEVAVLEYRAAGEDVLLGLGELA